MLETLDRSVDMYKIETGQYRKDPEIINCLPMVQEIAQNLRNASQHRMSPLQVLVDGVPPAPDARFTCLGQVELLRASLLNLMKNAMEATPEGETVVVDLNSEHGCRIEIRNRGVVPAIVRDRFFDKYSTAGKTYGTGLGTYSAKKMIEAQGGTVNMQTSDEKNETVVTILLPVELDVMKESFSQ